MFNFPSVVKYNFGLRDNLAFQVYQSLFASGARKEFNGYAIMAVESYEMADSFLNQFIHEKKDGK